MGVFLTDAPAVTPAIGGRVRLLEDVIYVDDTGRRWLAPKGWLVDGASIPWIFQLWWKPFDKRYFQSACIHDVRFCVHDATFKATNRLFRECLHAQGWEMSKLFYAAVSSPFGWYSYNYIPNIEENLPLEEVVRKFNEEQACKIPVFWGYDPVRRVRNGN